MPEHWSTEDYLTALQQRLKEDRAYIFRAKVTGIGIAEAKITMSGEHAEVFSNILNLAAWPGSVRLEVFEEPTDASQE